MGSVDEMAWDVPGLALDEYLQHLAKGILHFYEAYSDHIRILLYSGLEGHELSRIFQL